MFYRGQVVATVGLREVVGCLDFACGFAHLKSNLSNLEAMNSGWNYWRFP